MTFGSRGLALVAALAIASLPRGARADDADALAARSFRAGEAAYRRGDYDNAAIAFEEAHRQSPRGAAMYNAGLAWELAKAPTRAADAYATGLREGGLTPAQAADARAKLTALEKGLGQVRVSAPAGSLITVGAAAAARPPLVVHVAPGRQVVRVELPGGESTTRTVEAVAGAVAEVAIDAPPGAPQPLGPRAPPPSPARGPSPAAFVVGGGAIVAAGVAAGLGVAALSAKGSYDDSGHTDANARARAASLQTGANVTWIVAGGLAVTSMVLFFVTKKPANPGIARISF